MGSGGDKIREIRFIETAYYSPVRVVRTDALKLAKHIQPEDNRGSGNARACS
jgi:hypothetical protein